MKPNRPVSLGKRRRASTFLLFLFLTLLLFGLLFASILAPLLNQRDEQIHGQQTIDAVYATNFAWETAVGTALYLHSETARPWTPTRGAVQE